MTSLRTRRLRGDRSVGARFREDKGYAIAMTAMLILPLCVAVAFAVDVGAWYAQGIRIQRAADAAALAGVVYMPDTATAYAVAREVAAKNGFPSGGAITVTPQGTGNNLSVAIKGPASVFFGGAGGVKNENLTRSATAEYLVSIQMGSPLNYSGNDPDIGTVPAAGADGNLTNYPQFWLNSAGFATSKSNGDRFTAGNCSGSSFGCGTGTPTNNEYRPEGYVYTVDVKAGHGPLAIQVFDPAAVNTDDMCGSARNTTSGSRNLIGDQYALLNATGTSLNAGFATSDVSAISTQFTNAGIVNTTNGAPLNVAARWGRVDQGTAAQQTAAKTFCDGDWVDTGGTTPPDVKTTYIVRAPDNSPLDNLDNPPVCAITFDAYGQKGVVGTTAANSTPNFNVFQKLASPATATAQGYPASWGNANWNNDALSGTEKVAFWKHFHNWFTICNIATPQVGKYIIQVRNNADTSSLGSTPQTTATSGLDIGTLGAARTTQSTNTIHNRFTLRAGWSSNTPANISAAGGTAWSQDLQLSADNKFPIYTNQSSSDTTFYLARLTPEYKGHKVQLSLWDIGDGANANLTILPPTESPSAITSCSWDRDGSTMPGSVTYGPEPCRVNSLSSADFNGHLTNATILLDNNYTCTSTAGTGCWFRIRIQTTGTPNDTTTWSANVLGNPVHLVK